ncbi:MAG: AbrB/MazE/SpoVT family DNA-binding domain-containing protein [Actinobacteria bacterium]|nr:AbrB/MazE/SpoVT family DNA-binding domain-containing protein [Actinomycetota bacterium]
MLTTIDAAGRIVIPKAIRDRLGLSAGVHVDIVDGDGRIEITPSSATVEIVDTPNGPVARARPDQPVLDSATVRDVLESTRR